MVISNCTSFRIPIKPCKGVIQKSIKLFRSNFDFLRDKLLKKETEDDFSISLNKDLNNEQHHTSGFQIAGDHLIVRRGQTFLITLEFKEDTTHLRRLFLKFSMRGEKRQSQKYGTMVYLRVAAASRHVGTSLKWQAGVQSHIDNLLRVRVQTPPDTPISKWQLKVFATINSKKLSSRVKRPIYILFNPWCFNDAVFMSGIGPHEYVKNPNTLISCGCHNTIVDRFWSVGQFKAAALESAFDILIKKAKLSVLMRSDPLQVCMAILRHVSPSNYEGILKADWVRPPDEFYPGTDCILEHYNDKKKAVLSGQSWIFAGAFLSLARAVGLPCRIVSIFNPSIKAKYSEDIETYIDESLSIELSNGNFWNFHCFNEVWLKRPDLTDFGDYDGWQIVDVHSPTPQKRKNYCGPFPVKAMRDNEQQIPFDGTVLQSLLNRTQFVYKYWKGKDECELCQIRDDKLRQSVWTKNIDSWTRLNITNEYLYPESFNGSLDENLIVLQKQLVLEGLEHELVLPPAGINYGKDFEVKLLINNSTKKAMLHILGKITVSTMLYNCSNRKPIKYQKFKITINRGHAEKIVMPVAFNDYMDSYNMDGCFHVMYFCRFKDTQKGFYNEDVFRMVQPKMEMTLLDARMGFVIPTEVHIRFKNTLPIILTDCSVFLYGPLDKEPSINKVGDVLIDEEISCFMGCQYAGKLKFFLLTARFVSNQISFATACLFSKGTLICL